ncbi:preprotein translocase subunit YajC [Planctomycetota bacterium]
MPISFALVMAQSDQDTNLAPTLVMFGLMFAIFYFLVIRPQKRRESERQDMLSRLKKNDRVLTQGGIYGIVSTVHDNDVTLKIDLEKNVRVRVSRSAVAEILTDDSRSGKAS